LAELEVMNESKANVALVTKLYILKQSLRGMFPDPPPPPDPKSKEPKPKVPRQPEPQNIG